VVKGNHIQQFINGKPTVEVTDETAEAAKLGSSPSISTLARRCRLNSKTSLLTEK
jgi:hypothetical protein